MLRRVLFAALLTVFLPVSTLATEGADLSLPSSKIKFSKEILIAGDTVRVYATVENKGTEDISGYVVFYQGTEELGKSQIVSVVAGGEDEQVWVDFTVPYGPFNIRAEIRGTDPTDVNSGNDLALTALYTPTVDEDRDGVADDSDNCPEEDNENQKDTDGDGEGDACDDDDDNDGLSDEVEEEAATNTTSSDTDGDGIEDADDYYPNDSTRSVKEVAVVTVAPVSTESEASSQEPEDVTPEPTVATPTASTEVLEEISETEIHLATGGTFQISPRAAFAFVQEDWKTYTFQSLSVLGEGATIAWDFGDGVTSAADKVTHVFRSPGTYRVRLTVSSVDGAVVEDTQTIKISPFHLGNPIIQIALGVLVLLLASSGAVVLHRSRRGTIQQKTSALTSEESLPKKEEIIPEITAGESGIQRISLNAEDEGSLAEVSEDKPAKAPARKPKKRA